MGNASYGIRISQSGTSVDKAADYQKTIDERWPIVEFSFMGIVELNSVSTAAAGTIAYIPVYHHGLGFLPGFRLKDIRYSGFTTSDSSLEQLAVADEQDIYIPVSKSEGQVLTVSIKFFLAVIDRDISQEYQAAIDVVTAQQSNSASEYGLKILNKSVALGMKERNKAAYALNTNAKSMAIQMHGVRTAQTSGTYTGYLLIEHRLGYPPTYNIAHRTLQTGSANPFAGRTMVGPLGAGVALGFSDGVTLRLRGGQSGLGGDYLFLILKDPVDTAK